MRALRALHAVPAMCAVRSVRAARGTLGARTRGGRFGKSPNCRCSAAPGGPRVSENPSKQDNPTWNKIWQINPDDITWRAPYGKPKDKKDRPTDSKLYIFMYFFFQIYYINI